MKQNNITKALRQADKNIFGALRKAYDFDFEADFSTYEISTPFTLGKVERLIAPRYTLSKLYNRDTVVVLFVYGDECKGYHRNDIVGVEALGTGASDFNITIERERRTYPSKLSQFYAKYEFNDERKGGRDGVKVFVLCQHSKDANKPYKEPTVDEGERANKYEQNRYSHRYMEFDKSGYRVDVKRETLERKARELRRERDKARVDAIDKTAIIEELQKRVDIAKEVLVARLKASTTADELEAIGESLTKWRDGLGGAVRVLERIKSDNNGYGFSTPEQFNSFVDGVNRRVDAVLTGKDI